MSFNKYIEEIENELNQAYLSGAIQWADTNHNNAWSKAIDAFDKALREAAEHQYFSVLATEGKRYRDTLMDLIKKYKAHMGMEETDSFLSALKTKQKLRGA